MEEEAAAVAVVAAVAACTAYEDPAILLVLLVLLVFVLYIFSIIGITFFMGHQVRQLPRRDQSAHPESHPSPVFLPKRALS